MDTPLITALQTRLGRPFGANDPAPRSSGPRPPIPPTIAATRVLETAFSSGDALTLADLETLLAAQLGQRDPRESSGYFGPAGWLIESGVIGLLLGAITSLPDVPRDVIKFAELPRGAYAQLLERLPAALLDSTAACGPTTRTLASAAARNPRVQATGYVVGPDRPDERLMLDGAIVAIDEKSGPVTDQEIDTLLESHDWDAVLASDYAQELLSKPDAPYAESALQCLHTSTALRPLWPAIEEHYGLTGAAHPPDEITFVDRGLRLWWRWGGGAAGCPSQSDPLTRMTHWELARMLPRAVA